MGWYHILKDFAAPAVALVGVGVTAGFAFAGLKTFDRWKRENWKRSALRWQPTRCEAAFSTGADTIGVLV
jgi:hypothetical protein